MPLRQRQGAAAGAASRGEAGARHAERKAGGEVRVVLEADEGEDAARYRPKTGSV